MIEIFDQRVIGIIATFIIIFLLAYALNDGWFDE